MREGDRRRCIKGKEKNRKSPLHTAKIDGLEGGGQIPKRKGERSMKTLIAVASIAAVFLFVAPHVLGQQMMSLDGKNVSSMSSLANGVYLTEENGVIIKVVVLDGRVLVSRPSARQWLLTGPAAHKAQTFGNNGDLNVSLSARPTKVRFNGNLTATVTSPVGDSLRSAIANMPCDGATPLNVLYKIELYKGDPVKISEVVFHRSIKCTPIPRRRLDPIYDIVLENGSRIRIVTENVADVLGFFDVTKKMVVSGTTIWGPGQDWPHKRLSQTWELTARLDVQVELRGNTLLTLSGWSKGVKVIVFRK